jgi:hypothetical protein
MSYKKRVTGCHVVSYEEEDTCHMRKRLTCMSCRVASQLQATTPWMHEMMRRIHVLSCRISIASNHA